MMGKKATMDKRGTFIVIDGMDGAGKGTQIELLKKRLGEGNALFTREPGGSPKAEEIRMMILTPSGPQSNPICDLFLFCAARGSHIEDVVEPARERGMHVICDRYDSSTFAFQLYGEETQHDLKDLFFAIREELSDDYRPDLYIFLDLPAEVAFKRRSGDHAQAKSRFDLKPLEYHQRVRKGFQEFAKHLNKEGHSAVGFVDAEQTPEEMHEDIWRLVRTRV